ncbi:MAG: Mrp/NBP35 family ATP-binding protein [Candidatus Bathyarchaeia archaeon]|jgi:ATP-binding protein involved in chromosome partitioning
MANPNQTTTQCEAECETCTSQDQCSDQEKEQQKLNQQLKKIKYKIAVISGKGGVGKSTVTANLAMGFAMQGYKVGVLDADIHGPCIPKMLGLKGKTLNYSSCGVIAPVVGRSGVKVASIDFLLQSDEQPVIWRGPLKMRLIQQFLSYVAWGELDFLFVDLPPGTGDEPLTVTQLIPDMDGVLIVTMPSELSEAVVKKSVSFAKQVGVPVIGIIENMSGFVCPDCGKKIDIFQSGGGMRIAEAQTVPYLGNIPIDPSVCNDADQGLSVIEEKKESPTTKSLMEILQKIKIFLEKKEIKQ